MHNLEAEQGLLGIILANNVNYDQISDILRPYHFYQPQHGELFSLIQMEIENGRKASIVGLSGKVKDLGTEQLLAYSESFAFESNGRHYAELIIDCYKRRQISQLSKEVGKMAELSTGQEVFSYIEKSLTEINEEKAGDEVSVFEAAGEAISWMSDIHSGRIKPIKTGLKYIDEKIGGLYSGRLYIVAGRPGMGKTALALTISDNVSESLPVLFLSLEMARSELAMRLIASRTGIGVDRQQSPQGLNDNDWVRIEQARQMIKDRKIIIHDSGKIDIFQIKTWCRRFKRKNGKFVLMIDYLGLMQMDKDIKNRVHQIEDITVSLKALAKELDIPIVLLSQLSRSVEGRDDKRPMLSDLRDSGAIEQDADVVMLCYREEYYLSKNEPKRNPKQSEDQFQKAIIAHEEAARRAEGKAEVIIAKNRQGRDGIAYLKFDGNYQKFTD